MLILVEFNFAKYVVTTNFTLQGLLEEKNDQHGRNGTLLAYVAYQSTLPHPDDVPPTPVTPSHSHMPQLPSSVPTQRKYSRLFDGFMLFKCTRNFECPLI